MKKYLQVVSISLLVVVGAGCLSQEVKDGLGAVGGGLVGGLVGKKVGGNEGAAIGALLGAAVGGSLTHYLTQQDKENISNVLDNPETANKPVSWCPGSRSIQEGGTAECGAGAKPVTVTAGNIEVTDGRECRSTQLEVPDDTGKINTVTEKLCKDNNGKWQSV